MAKSYDPHSIDASGVRSLYLGRNRDAPIVKCLESFCHQQAKTLSDSTRSIIEKFFIEKKILDEKRQPGPNFTDYLEAGEKAKEYNTQQILADQELQEKKTTKLRKA